MQVSLLWNNHNDLDLHVRCPSREIIYYRHKRSRCRGVLDVDMNAGGSQVTDEPVENVFWSRAPKGTYEVAVHYFANRGGEDPTEFKVAIKIGNQVEEFTGTLRRGDPPTVVAKFRFPQQ